MIRTIQYAQIAELAATQESQSMLTIKIKRLSEFAELPCYQKSGDAGMDLVATSRSHIVDNVITYGTGLAIEIPKGYAGFIYPRSSIYKYDLSLANSIGVIDSGYRNEILLKFIVRGAEMYAVGDRIAQLIIMPFPLISFKEVDKLDTTDRGQGGFGHTGR